MVTRRPADIGIALALLVTGACGQAAAEGPVPEADSGEPALFVSNKYAGTLTKVALESGAVLGEAASCETPHELAASPDGLHIAVGCYGGRDVAIFRAGDLGRVRTIALGDGARPHGIVWHSGGAIFVTAEGRQSIYRISDPLGDRPLLTEIATQRDGTHLLAVDPQARRAWTMDMFDGTVTLIDLEAGRAMRSVAMGVEPEGVALTPDGETLWVSARGEDQAFALDPDTLERRGAVGTGAFPLRMAIRPQGDFAVTSNYMDGTLSVIDLATNGLVRTIAVSGRREAEQVTILFSPDGNRVYVAETADDSVAEIDFASGRVLRRLPAGDGGDGLALVE